MLAKTDAIEDHVIKLNVKLNHLETTPSNARNSVVRLGTIDMDELRQFGLPLDSESELDILNQKLKNDVEFNAKLVNCF